MSIRHPAAPTGSRAWAPGPRSRVPQSVASSSLFSSSKSRVREWPGTAHLSVIGPLPCAERRAAAGVTHCTSQGSFFQVQVWDLTRTKALEVGRPTERQSPCVGPGMIPGPEQWHRCLLSFPSCLALVSFRRGLLHSWGHAIRWQCAWAFFVVTWWVFVELTWAYIFHQIWNYFSNI